MGFQSVRVVKFLRGFGGVLRLVATSSFSRRVPLSCGRVLWGSTEPSGSVEVGHLLPWRVEPLSMEALRTQSAFSLNTPAESTVEMVMESVSVVAPSSMSAPGSQPDFRGFTTVFHSVYVFPIMFFD